jgi:Holliday junction resolvase
VAKQPETVLKERVLADLRQLPRTHAVKIQQVVIRGTLDILACVDGHFVAIELKRDEKQKLEKLQEHEMEKIKKAGGRAYLVHPLNWPGVLAELTSLATGLL